MLAGPKIVTHDEVVAMAVIWDTRKKPRFEIRDKDGNVISIGFACGRKSCPAEKIVFERPMKRKKRRGA
jgi:hypothetical protein